jgi:hypothetical protein
LGCAPTRSTLLYNHAMQQAPSSPIMVTIVEQNEISSLGDVMLEAIGLTGVIAVGAVIFGLLLAGVIIGYRKVRTRLEPEEEVQTQPLGLTPTEGVGERVISRIENLKSKI